MFERFTENARRVIFFARFEASGFGSPYIETEHMLLGLLREDKALANRFLRSSGSVESMRKQIEGHTTIREKLATSVDLPLSNECKRVLAYAAEEAERLAHPHIGTEHLLLGLLRESDTFAAQILAERGVDVKTVRETLAKAGVSSGTRPSSALRSEIEQRLRSEIQQGLTRGLLEVVIIPEEGGPPLRPSWRARVPAVGEVVAIKGGPDDLKAYHVIRVEWEVDATTEAPYLEKALVHVREVRSTA